MKSKEVNEFPTMLSYLNGIQRKKILKDMVALKEKLMEEIKNRSNISLSAKKNDKALRIKKPSNFCLKNLIIKNNLINPIPKYNEQVNISFIPKHQFDFVKYTHRRISPFPKLPKRNLSRSTFVNTRSSMYINELIRLNQKAGYEKSAEADHWSNSATLKNTKLILLKHQNYLDTIKNIPDFETPKKISQTRITNEKFFKDYYKRNLKTFIFNKKKHTSRNRLIGSTSVSSCERTTLCSNSNTTLDNLYSTCNTNKIFNSTMNYYGENIKCKRCLVKLPNLLKDPKDLRKYW